MAENSPVGMLLRAERAATEQQVSHPFSGAPCRFSILNLLTLCRFPNSAMENIRVCVRGDSKTSWQRQWNKIVLLTHGLPLVPNRPTLVAQYVRKACSSSEHWLKCSRCCAHMTEACVLAAAQQLRGQTNKMEHQHLAFLKSLRWRLSLYVIWQEYCLPKPHLHSS